MEKFQSRLSKWKANNIFGRLTLLKSMFGILPLYYFSIFKALKVLDLLESLRKKFLWGGNKNKKKILWMNWNTITRSKNHDGFGIIGLRSLNLVLLAICGLMLKNVPDSFRFPCIKYIHKIYVLMINLWLNLA